MMATKIELKPNTLVQYKGGGYDGCFWEWNYAYLDGKGKFHCIIASGYKGCKTKTDLKNVDDEDAYIYDLTDPESILDFGKESGVDHVIGVAKWFAEKKIDVEFRTICDECGKNVPVLTCEAEGMECTGGISYQHNQTICHECHEKGSCAYCGDYVGPDRIHPETGLCHDKKLDGSWDEGCGWCHEEHGDDYR